MRRLLRSLPALAVGVTLSLLSLQVEAVSADPSAERTTIVANR